MGNDALMPEKEKVLVTGGAGFIGSHIVDKLIKNGHEVVIVDNLYTGSRENINYKAKFYEVDLISLKECKKIFEVEKPQIVIHQAGQISVQKSLDNPIDDANINIIGAINILECCREYSTKKIIYASSAAIYGDPQYLGIDEEHPYKPTSFYGISKLTPEYYIKLYSKLHNIKFTILRYSNVYGIRQNSKGEGGVISIFIDNLLKNKQSIIYGDGNQTRDFIYVKDVVNANIKAISKGNNLILNISTNKQISVRELLDIIIKTSKIKVSPIYMERRSGDIINSYMDNKKAKVALNWKPNYTLEQGIKEMLIHYGQNN